MSYKCYYSIYHCSVLDEDAEGMKEAEKCLLPVAKQYINKWKESNKPPEMLFFYTGKDDDDDILKSLRAFANIPETNPLLVILDIPGQKVYIAEGGLSEEKVRDFVDKFFNDDLPGKPLRS